MKPHPTSEDESAVDLKRAEDALRENEERYRALFDLAPVAVYSCDASGVIQEYNKRAAELWGRKPELGDTDERFCGSFKLYRPDGSFMPHEQCPMGDVLTGRIPGTHDAEVHIERPDGSRIIVIVNIAPLRDDRAKSRERSTASTMSLNANGRRKHCARASLNADGRRKPYGRAKLSCDLQTKNLNPWSKGVPPRCRSSQPNLCACRMRSTGELRAIYMTVWDSIWPV
jgi:PAS domain-containing protein